MRLIDADALKRYIDCGHLRPPDEICLSELAVVQMVDRAPTIDAVEVVRCKDCKYCKQHKNAQGMMTYKCKWLQIFTYLEAYCCWGKRSDQEAQP